MNTTAENHIDEVMTLMRDSMISTSREFFLDRARLGKAGHERLLAEKRAQRELEEAERIKALNGARDPYSDCHDTQWS